MSNKLRNAALMMCGLTDDSLDSLHALRTTLLSMGAREDENGALSLNLVEALIDTHGVTPLTFDALRSANVARCERWHPQGIGSWSPSDWLTAAMGELGELASEVKMFNRERDGLVGNKETMTPEERKQRMAKEAADVVAYLDLFCAERGIDLGEAVAKKFNEVSVRNGFPERLGGV